MSEDVCTVFALHYLGNAECQCLASQERIMTTHTMLVQQAAKYQEVVRVELHCGTDSWHYHTYFSKTTSLLFD